MTGHILFSVLSYHPWYHILCHVRTLISSGLQMVSSAGLCGILDTVLFPLCHAFLQCFHHISVLDCCLHI